MTAIKVKNWYYLIRNYFTKHLKVTQILQIFLKKFCESLPWFCCRIGSSLLLTAFAVVPINVQILNQPKPMLKRIKWQSIWHSMTSRERNRNRWDLNPWPFDYETCTSQQECFLMTDPHLFLHGYFI